MSLVQTTTNLLSHSQEECESHDAGDQLDPFYQPTEQEGSPQIGRAESDELRLNPNHWCTNGGRIIFEITARNGMWILYGSTLVTSRCRETIARQYEKSLNPLCSRKIYIKDSE